MRVVNDIAERGVALMDEYNKLHTTDEEQKQFLLLVVKEYHQWYPDSSKKTHGKLTCTWQNLTSSFKLSKEY